MAVYVKCDDPQKLLTTIRKSVRSGTITTWLVDSDGDLTRALEQWKHKAWFRPRIGTERIVFNILAPKGKQLSRTQYGVYHAKLIETLLNHFDLQFEEAIATALPVTGDMIKPPS